MKRALLGGLGRIGRRAAGLPIGRVWRGAVASLRAPAQKWNGRKRLMAYVALAAGAFVLVTAGWRALWDRSSAASVASIEALERRLVESRAKLARLPEMRAAASKQAEAARADRTMGGDRRAVADLAALAARTGVTLRALEPASAVDSAHPRHDGPKPRALRIAGRGDFAGFYGFLQGLPTLPALVVPEMVSVKRESGALAFAATLHVFEGVAAPQAPPAAVKATAGSAGDESERSLADPFRVDMAARRPDASASRLVGLVRDASRSLAVFEGASGARATLVAPGQAIGAERVVRIDLGGVLLASRAGERRIVLQEGER
jgi:hypothetical protein